MCDRYHKEIKRKIRVKYYFKPEEVLFHKTLFFPSDTRHEKIKVTAEIFQGNDLSYKKQRHGKFEKSLQINEKKSQKISSKK